MIFFLAANSLSLAQSRNAGEYEKSGSSFPDTCYLFYGGDFDPSNQNANALQNETDAIVGGNPYGAATYQNFIVSRAVTVVGLFTNNLSGLNPATGYWEVRTGVSEGNGGTLIASGTSEMTQTATGRNGFGFTEYRDEVDGLNINLTPGTYWFAVVPNDPNNPNRSFNSNTFGQGRIGKQIKNLQFFNSAFFGANFTNADNTGGVFPTFSSGVLIDPSGCPMPSSTSLTVTPPDPTAGQVVTLSATVTSTNNPVDVGTVTFLNDKQEIATVQLNKLTGMAVLKIRFAPGTYIFTARYNATDSFQSSTSDPQLTIVTGTEPTQSTLAYVKNGNNYDFTLSVFGFGFPPLAGSANVLNLTQNNQLVGTIDVAGPGMQTFQVPTPYKVQQSPFQVAVADFNGDGILDLALTTNTSHNVDILLGNPNGTFQDARPYFAGVTPIGIAVGDFNGDGIADLAVTDNGSGEVDVLLGNGDGSFQSNEAHTVGTQPDSVVVADFNGDGIADLAVANNGGNNNISVLLGNGDGTFQNQMIVPAVFSGYAITAADFNGDSAVDLAVSSAGSKTLVVLLGNGDGTFHDPSPNQVGQNSFAVVAADFNTDGFIDLAATSANEDKVYVLLGNGDGTFKSPTTYATGKQPIGLTVSDINGDGIADLIAANNSGLSVSVLLGKDDGSFDAQQSYPAEQGPFYLAAADLNGDGVPDIAVANIGQNTTSILLNGTISTGQLANVPVHGIGFQDVRSTFTPTGDFFAGSDSNVLLLKGDGLPSTTTLASDRNPSNYGETVNFTATVSGVGGIPTGTVDFTADGIVICSAVQLVPFGNSSRAVCTTSTLTAGIHIIVASYSGDSNFQPSTSPPLDQQENPATPVFTNLLPNPTVTYGSSNVTLIGTLCVSQGPCAPKNEMVTVTIHGRAQATTISDDLGNFSINYNTAGLAAGSYTIDYHYAGDSNFTMADDQSTKLMVNPAVAAVTVTPYNVTYDAHPHTASGTAICGGLDVSGDLNLSGTTHTNAGNYATDPWSFHDPKENCKDANGTVHDVINQSVTSASLTASPPTHSQFGQTVTFTITVSGSNGGSPTGTVSFTADNAPIAGCSTVVLVHQGSLSTALCQTSSLTTGSHTVMAAYGGDSNFKASFGSLRYTVQVAGDFMVQVNPGSINVTQGFTNQNQPFFAQSINISAQPVGNYSGTVMLSCSVEPPLTSGTCTVNAPSSGSLADGNLNTTLTIAAENLTPLGDYTVTITAQDSNQLVHTANLALTVINQTRPGSMPPGGAVPVSVTFPGNPNTTLSKFVCSSVTGTGINGSEPFSEIGGVCTFSPGSINLPAPVTVTLSGCSVPVARLQRQSPILASVFFGIPGLLLLGPLFRRSRDQRRRTRRAFILFLLVLSFVLFGFGCGGGFGPLTPTGHYYVLVQGTGPDGATYSAVVPLTVTPLNN